MDEMTAASTATNTWICPHCQNSNTGKFCTSCGTARPATKEDKMDLPLDLLQQQVTAGDPAALYELFRRINDDLVEPEDDEQGMRLLEKSAALGNTNALLALAIMYRFDPDNTEAMPPLALEYYQKAVDAGSTEAMVQLGDYYTYEDETDESDQMAMRYYQKAEQLGSTDAMNGIGTLYYLGKGVDTDQEEARRWYQKAIDLGNVTAMDSMGDYYYYKADAENGLYTQAMSWYKKAAAAGESSSMHSLGKMYEKGLGCLVDKQQALFWYKKKAEADEDEENEDVLRLQKELAATLPRQGTLPPNPVSPPQPSPASAENKNRQAILIALVVLFAILAGFFALQAYSKNHAASTPTAQKAAANIPEASSELSLGNVSIGYSLEQVHTALGKEDSVEQRENGLVAYKYKDLNVILKGNLVQALESNTSAAKTKRNIHQDSTLDNVLKAYGSDVTKTAYKDLMLYEYDKLDDNKKTCRMRFAIDKNNKVRYITIRTLEDSAPSSDQPQKAEDTAAAQQAAKAALQGFHNNISQHHLLAAYNYMSPDLQGQISYDGWAPGFDNTIRSTVSNIKTVSATANKVVLTYHLQSYDKPNITKNFSGIATIVKTDNGWKIDDMKNK